MPYNLLDEAWIPVRREDDSHDLIRPCQISETENPPIRLDAPRPDFNGALIQFLIGLVQTTFAPRHEREWRRWFKSPPSPAELDAACDWCRDAFNVDGNGPRFMQDLDRECLSATSAMSIQQLLFDGPDKKVVEDNKDHFVKSTELHFSAPWAAIVLFTRQINAYHLTAGGGRFHWATIRSSYPATTVVLGGTLWETVWLNVLVADDFETLAEQRERDKKNIFPWLDRQDASYGRQKHRADVHAAQLYWPMPMRISLDPANHCGVCAISGEPEDRVYKSYRWLGDGINYQPPWMHPLSPMQNGGFISLSDKAVTYEGWTTLVGADRSVIPALTVNTFFRRSPQLFDGRRPEVWAFGYSGKKANVHRYYDATMPLFPLRNVAVRPDFEEFASGLVDQAATAVNGGEKAQPPGLRHALQRALFGTYKKNQKTNKFTWDFPKSRKDASARQKSIVSHTTARFWKDTESDFYGLLSVAQEELDTYPDEDPDATLDPLRAKWKKIVRKKVRALFNEVTGYGTFHASDPRSVAQAHIELEGTISNL